MEIKPDVRGALLSATDDIYHLFQLVAVAPVYSIVRSPTEIPAKSALDPVAVEDRWS